MCGDVTYEVVSVIPRLLLRVYTYVSHYISLLSTSLPELEEMLSKFQEYFLWSLYLLVSSLLFVTIELMTDDS
jgi:hypothetical protein